MSWRFSICDGMEREAGHVAISLAVAALGVLAWHLGYPDAKDIVVGALGWAARSMGSAPARTP